MTALEKRGTGESTGSMIKLCICWVVLLSGLLPGAIVAADRPNIVLILADDMGYSDIGCYGGEVQTPHIDSLAKGGIRFTQFYNTARCCPTRASLLTGLYPHQAGVGHMVDNQRLPLDKRQLSDRAVTIAEVLRSAGYRTAMTGKWHVTPVNESQHNWPIQRGFERFYGIIHGAASFYDPVTLRRDNEPISEGGKDYNFTDAISDNAVSYVEDFSKGDAPFFLYMAYTAPHWPLHDSAEAAEKYQTVYAKGWDVLRQERLDRMKQMGLVSQTTMLTPRDSTVRPWDEVPNKAWNAHRMAIYAAMIERMDRGIGRVMNKLKEKGELDNTLILFLSDNGGCAEVIGPRWTGLHIPRQTRDGRPVRLGNDPSIWPGADDTYASYGVGWANLSNAPFRSYKHWVHEGGIATPLVVHWPKGVKQGGRIDHTPGHLIDVMATCVEVSGAAYPGTRDGREIKPMEGKSLLPVFENGNLAERPIFFEHEGNRAVREGKWKLVSRFAGETWGPWELYDMSVDRVEMNNLAAVEKEVAGRLEKMYDQWAKRAEVTPWVEVVGAK